MMFIRNFVFAALAACAMSCFAVRPLDGEDETGFESLFDGQTLGGWDGDPRFWRVENGFIVGQTTSETAAEKNTFLIYRGAEFADFELRFSYQVEGYNSGVQYRSVDLGDWGVSGYQSDFEASWHKIPGSSETVDRFSGMFFEEKGRMFLAQRGEAVIVRPSTNGKAQIERIGVLGDAAQIEKVIKRGDWNEMTVLASGNQFVHAINGRVTAIGLDLDPDKRRSSGILAFQLHRGPPMKIQLKNIRLRRFK